MNQHDPDPPAAEGQSESEDTSVDLTAAAEQQNTPGSDGPPDDQ
jgi:hypothetical protein